MRYVLIDTDEFESPRFARLCCELGAETPGDRFQVIGHLTSWYMHWGRPLERDAGVWFNASMGDIGGWTGVLKDEALRWGRALWKAGYIATLKEAYPAPLGTIRDGWVAKSLCGGARIDANMQLFLRRSDTKTLVLYVQDRVRRCEFARHIRLDVEQLEREEKIPAGWLTPESDHGAQHNNELGGHNASTFQTERLRQESLAAAILPRRTVIGFGSPASASSADETLHTANPKSSELLATVRRLKYDDPEQALLALDGSKPSAVCWHKAVANDRVAVSELLAEMVASHETWAKIRNPASVAMSQLKKLRLC